MDCAQRPRRHDVQMNIAIPKRGCGSCDERAQWRQHVRRSKTVLQWIRGHIGYTGLRADPRWLIFRGFTGLGCFYERDSNTTASTAAREHGVDDEMHRFSATKKRRTPTHTTERYQKKQGCNSTATSSTKRVQQHLAGANISFGERLRPSSRVDTLNKTSRLT